MVEERSTINNQTQSSQYIWGTRLIKQLKGGQGTYYHDDGQGSIKALSDASGNLSDQYQYDAFGNQTQHQGNSSQAYRFAGEYFDSSVGMQYHRARWYDLRVGRFASRDPFSGYPVRPATLHKYAYAGNDPVNSVDPSGWVTLGEYIESLNTQSTLSTINLRLTVNRLKNDVACVVVETIAEDLITNVIIEGVYFAIDGVGSYIGQSGDIATRLKQHAASDAKKISANVEDLLAVFHINGGKNDRRLIEQTLFDAFGATVIGNDFSNEINSIAENPISKNSKELRAILKNGLDICP